MKRRQCSGRNAKDTGPCQATASEGFETCARCGDRRKPRGFPSMEKRRASQADIARRPPTNSLGEPWVEGQTWTCTGCGATGPDRDDVRMPESCECVAPMVYMPPEHDAAIGARHVERARAQLEAEVSDEAAPAITTGDDGVTRWNPRWLHFCDEHGLARDCNKIARAAEERGEAVPMPAGGINAAFMSWVRERWAEWGATQTPKIGAFDTKFADHHVAFDAWLAERAERVRGTASLHDHEEPALWSVDRDGDGVIVQTPAGAHRFAGFSEEAAIAAAREMYARDVETGGRRDPDVVTRATLCESDEVLDAIFGDGTAAEMHVHEAGVRGALDHEADSRPACGNCGACALCDVVLAYEDAALAAPEEFTASAVSPETHRPVVEGSVEVVDASTPAVRLLRARGHEVWHATWRQLAERAASLGGVDTTLPDAPYSDRTHRGHDSGTSQANRVADWGAREAAKGRTKKAGGVSLARMIEYAEEHGAPRRALNYRPWTDADVLAFVDAWAPLTRGWFGTLTDHVLAPFWEAAFKRHGRYVFSPLACVDPGSRFRAVGDGPAQWACWLVVSRPSTGAWLDEWRDKRKGFGLPRALRGGHCDPRGRGDSQTGNREEKVPGAKPLWMMLDILSDYSMPGELIADPTCGGGTLGEAAEILGRRALLGDSMREHAEQTVRTMRGTRRAVVADADRDSLQLGLLANG